MNSPATYLGIELGSTRIKAVAIDADHQPCSSGDYTWASTYENGIWTYPLEQVWTGLKAVIPPETLSRVGIGMVMLVGLVSLLFISPQALDSGLRFPGHLVAVGTMHLLWAVRMGPAPLDSDVDGKTEMEIVVGEGDADAGGN